MEQARTQLENLTPCESSRVLQEYWERAIIMKTAGTQLENLTPCESSSVLLELSEEEYAPQSDNCWSVNSEEEYTPQSDNCWSRVCYCDECHTLGDSTAWVYNGGRGTGFKFNLCMQCVKFYCTSCDPELWERNVCRCCKAPSLLDEENTLQPDVRCAKCETRKVNDPADFHLGLSCGLCEKNYCTSCDPALFKAPFLCETCCPAANDKKAKKAKGNFAKKAKGKIAKKVRVKKANAKAKKVFLAILAIF